MQPPAWVELLDVRAGALAPLPLDLVKMGLPADMAATVTAIEPCPALAPGDGRVVLTTVNHLNNDVWQLTAVDAAGRREDLRPTGFHKFYSETRGDWVSTKDIHDNEVIRGRAGPLTIVASRQLPGAQRVFNLTVEGEHVYYVSELELLAHNTNCARQDVALGLTHGRNGERIIDTFADSVGAVPNSGWIPAKLADEGPFVKRFYQALYRSTSEGGRIKFNLDDLKLGDAFATPRFSDPFTGIRHSTNVTNWELQQVLNNRQFYDATDFYIGGQKLFPDEILGFELHFRGN